MFTIEKGVPFKDGRADGRPTKYPWAEMEVGDSFVVYDASRNAMSATGRYHTRKTGKVYRASTEDDHVRVWRVS